MNRVNQLLVICLVAQGLVFAGLKLTTTSSRGVERSSPLSGLDLGKVKRISIEAPENQATFKDNSFTLEKSGEQWTLADAEGFPVDQNKVTGLSLIHI